MGVNTQTRYTTTLSASVTDTATTIDVTLAPAFSSGYATIDRGNSSQEDIKWRTLAGTQMGTCLRGLSSTATTDTEVGGNKKSHIATATIEGTTLHYIFNNKTDADEAETVTGNWIVSGSWTLSGSNTFTGLNTFQRTATTGYTAYFARDLAAASTDSPIVCILNDNTGDDQSALKVVTDATNSGSVTAGEFIATNLGNAGATVAIKNNGGGVDTNAVFLAANNSSSSGSNQFYRNLPDSGTAGPVMSITQDHVGDNQPCLTLRQDAPYYALKITADRAWSSANGMLSLSSSINDAAPVIGMDFTLINAGAGLEYAFSFNGSEAGVTAAGNAGFVSNNKGTLTLVGFIRVNAGGEFYIPYGTIA